MRDLGSFNCYTPLEEHTYDSRWCSVHGRVYISTLWPDGSHSITVENERYSKAYSKNTTPTPKMESNMTQPTDIPGMPSPDARATYDFLANKARANGVEESKIPSFEELQDKVAVPKSFYQANKEIIHTAAIVFVLFKMNKRMVGKATAKAIEKALSTQRVMIDIPQYTRDWEAFNLANTGEKLLTETWNNGVLTNWK